MTAQFVILHHVLDGGEHWDLMLEKDGMLATWQLPLMLTGSADLPMTARRIGDHRLDYLTYEGPISANRGRVTRVEKGWYECLASSPGCWIIRLEGERLKLQLELRLIQGDEWSMRVTTNPSDSTNKG